MKKNNRNDTKAIKKIIALHRPLVKPKINSDEKLTEKRCESCSALLAKARPENHTIEVLCKCGKMNIFETEDYKRADVIVKREDLLKELMQLGIGLKRSTLLIERFKLYMISPGN